MGDWLPNWATYCLIALSIVLVLLLRSLGNGVILRLRRRRQHITQARRHFVKAAMSLNKARSEKLSANEARSLATIAINEADLAIELNPKDAATLIVKSLALRQIRKPAAALKVLNAALAQELSSTLSKEERADTLLQRAEILLEQMKGNKDNRIKDVFKDLQESISLQPSTAHAHYLLGSCYERTGDLEAAVGAYQEALALGPSFPNAQAALDRIRKSCEKDFIAVPV